MKKWLKIIGLIVLVLLVVGGTRVYFKLKEVGIIPRNNYETTAPDIPEFNRPAILVLNKTNGFVHVDAIPAADTMLREIAETNGWDIFITNNAATHSAEVLGKFDLVVWNNTSGDILTESQRRDLRSWLESGGGWVGLHAAGGDFNYKWRWYVETLVGAQFVGHTMNPQFQDADVLKTEEGHDLTSHIPGPWNVKQEEWYAFDASPRAKGYEILLTLDESSYIVNKDSWMGTEHMEGEHPVAWRHERGGGRVLYSAIGHQANTYQVPEYREFIDRAMKWAMKKR